MIGEFKAAQPHAEEAKRIADEIWSEDDPKWIEAERLRLEVIWARGQRWMVAQDHVPDCDRLEQAARRTLPWGSRARVETLLTASRFRASVPNRIEMLNGLREEAEKGLGLNDRLTIRVLRWMSRELPWSDESLPLIMLARERAEATYGLNDPASEDGLGTESYLISRSHGNTAMTEHIGLHLAKAERLLGQTAHQVLIATSNYAEGLMNEGRLEEAAVYGRLAVQRARTKHGDDSVWLDTTLSGLLPILVRLGLTEEAAKVEAELWQLLGRQRFSDRLDIPAGRESLDEVVFAFDAMGNVSEAEKYMAFVRKVDAELAENLEKKRANNRGK